MGVTSYDPIKPDSFNHRAISTPRGRLPRIVKFTEQPMVGEAEISSPQGEDATGPRSFSSYGRKRM